jgi:BlaI family transcriptional regulator, penicillinase repressor
MSDIARGDRELDILGVLWTLHSATVAEVRHHLSAPLAYTTVLTTLRRLERKRAVTHEAEGGTHRFVPILSRSMVRAGCGANLIDMVFGGSPEELVAHLATDWLTPSGTTSPSPPRNRQDLARKSSGVSRACGRRGPRDEGADPS